MKSKLYDLLIDEQTLNSAKMYDNIELKCSKCKKIIQKHKRDFLKCVRLKRSNIYCSGSCANITSEIVKCKSCGKDISKQQHVLKRQDNYFCSQSCACTYNNIHRKPKTFTCIKCNKDFMTKAHKAKFCSIKCSAEFHKKRIIIQCMKCGKKYERIQGNIKNKKYLFCSNICKNQFFAMPENRQLRGSYAGYKGKSYISSYRKLAFGQYGKKCYYCGYNKHDSVLQVHHIDCNRDNNDVKNLRVLCCNCHAEMHLGLK